MEMTEAVLTIGDVGAEAVSPVFDKYGMEVSEVAADTAIPGSFWGDAEAGLIDNVLYLRRDTPVHSLLHEGCHYICMDQMRRHGLHTDAGGDYDEENAVCYLQILLAHEIPNVGSARLMQDMDRWGYTFRLGAARKWFEEDAEDARYWLLRHGLIDNNSLPTYSLRQ